MLTSYRSEAREAVTLNCRSLAPSSGFSSCKLQESVGTSLSEVYISMSGYYRSSWTPRAEMPQGLGRLRTWEPEGIQKGRPPCFSSEPPLHSSLWLGLSSPTHVQPGRLPGEHELHVAGSSFSPSQLKLCLICRHINSGWENGRSSAKLLPKRCGLQEGTDSGQKRACYPWTQESRVSTSQP